MRETQAQRRADRALNEAMGRCRRAGATKLPSVAVMARAASVAYVTMWKSVRRLQDAGVLRARPRRGIEMVETSAPLPTPEPSSTQPEDKGYRWQQVVAHIQRGIMAGGYAPGTLLPSAKQLREQLGVSHRTLRKAFARLVETKMVEPYRRGYRLPPLGPRRAGLRMALVTRGDTDGNVHLFYSGRHRELFTEAEARCSQNGIGFDTYAYDTGSATLYDRNGTKCPPAAIRGIHGVVVLGTGVLTAFLSDALCQWARLNTPVAIFDETGDAEIASLVTTLPSVKLFRVGLGSIHGEVVGRYLLQQGHKQVAYISSVHDNAWSVRRLEGLRTAYADAGFPSAVDAFTSAENAGPEPDRRTRAEQAEAYREMADQLEADERQNVSVAELAHMIHMQMRQLLNTTVSTEEVWTLARQALAHKGTTAWVTANDLMAHECLTYLRSKGTEVPKEMAVVGFDDTDREFGQQLTSYNHSIPAVARAMVAHTINWSPMKHRFSAPSVVEMPGYVIGRRTS